MSDVFSWFVAVFPVIGKVGGWLAHFASMPFSDFLNWLFTPGWTETVTNVLSGETFISAGIATRLGTVFLPIWNAVGSPTRTIVNFAVSNWGGLSLPTWLVLIIIFIETWIVVLIIKAIRDIFKLVL